MIARGFDRGGYERSNAWIETAATSNPLLEADAQDDVIQVYTSGTTGGPKGVRLTNRNYLTTFKLTTASGGLNYKSGHTVLAAMPFFHVAGVNIALIPMASGAGRRSSGTLRRSLFDTISRERVNQAFLAPALIHMPMQAPGIESADLSSMTVLSYGASPISEDLRKRASARFRSEFIQVYGMTEVCGPGTFLASADHDPGRGKLRSCGVALAGVELKIVAADGAEVQKGAVGEVVIRLPTVMKGYWNKPTRRPPPSATTGCEPATRRIWTRMDTSSSMTG